MYSWPLPRYFNTGIPSSSSAEPGGPRSMVAGDHIQLLYHFQLAADTIRGETPWFRNPYEFNRGEEDPRLGGFYYFPFGWIYGLLLFFGSPSFAWNLTGFFSLWAGYWAMGVLLRRHGCSTACAWIAALPVLCLPYRWISLLGGSPSGFSMMSVPVVLLGLDIAVRNAKPIGAWLAGSVLAAAMVNDLHTFYFLFITMPFWCAFVWYTAAYLPFEKNNSFRERMLTSLRRAFRLWPALACMVLAYLATALVNRDLEGTLHQEGYTLRQVMLFSPHFRGWLSWAQDIGASNSIYIGRSLAVLIMAGGIFLGWDVLRRKSGAVYRGLPYLALLLAAGAVAVVAVGPHVPFDRHVLVLRFLRRFVPAFSMLRQTAKVYTLMPVVLSLLLGYSLTAFLSRIGNTKIRLLLAVICAAVLLWDFGRRIQPMICLLDDTQGAYAAVKADAEELGRDNRAMAIPLWPGDSHWSSLYQHYAALYRTRMLNGYSPVVGRDYFTDIFLPLQWLNQGDITDKRLERLLDMNIGYLILHEDAFPEKVSTFPVLHTLEALLIHPRVRFLDRDRSVWAFRIEPAPDSAAQWDRPDGPRFRFPARIWEAEWFAEELLQTVSDPDGNASRDGFVVMEPGSRLVLPPMGIPIAEDMRYTVRAAGPGTLRFKTRVENDAPGTASRKTEVALPEDWTWVEAPLPDRSQAGNVTLEATAVDSTLRLDIVLLTAGDWPLPGAGDALTVPAAAFFRAGHSDPGTGVVVLEADRVAADEVFYGPRMPWPTGELHVSIDYRTDAPDGTELAEVSVAPWANAPGAARTILRAGEAWAVNYRHKANLPLTLRLRYTRAGDVTIKRVHLERRTAPDTVVEQTGP